MNDETTNAARLADWLEAGGDPPDDLDPDVLAVVYALQPDRAPKPRVSLDDILGGVTEGPFAIPAPTAAPAPEFPKGRESRGGLVVHDGERRDSAAPAKPARRGPSSFWMGPAFGIALAAAAAAVFVFPLASKIKGLGERATMPEFGDMAPAPTAAAPATGAGPTASVVPEMSAPMLEGARMEAPAVPTEPLERGKNAAAGDEKLDAPKASNDAIAQKTPMLDTTTASGGGGTRPGSPPADLAAATTTAAATTPPATMSAPVYEEQAPARERSEDLAVGYAESADRVIAEADVSDDEMTTAKAKKETESRRAAPSKSAAAAPASAPAAGATATTAATTTSSARDVATPLDYNPSWYTSDATVSALYAGPLALEAAGDRAGAAAAWSALISVGRTDVGQDAALRAAKDLRALGQNSEALRAVDSGLRRSSANTPFRAALYALRGDLFNAVGNNPQAEAAWKEAARLNMSR